MANNPGSRNWNDVQMVLAAMAMTLTVGLWNVFAAPDAALAKESAQEPAAPPPTEPTATIPTSPTALPPVKIMLGGVEPQTVIVQQAARRNNNNGGGGGGGGGPVTSTRSS